MSADHDIGMLTLAAHVHWQHAGWIERIMATIRGKHRVYVHLGMRLRVSFWRGRPYLVSIREAG